MNVCNFKEAYYKYTALLNVISSFVWYAPSINLFTLWQYRTGHALHRIKIFGCMIVRHFVALAFSAIWVEIHESKRSHWKRNKAKAKNWINIFGEDECSCGLLQRNPLNKNFRANLHVFVSLFFILWFPYYLFCICSLSRSRSLSFQLLYILPMNINEYVPFRINT